MMSEQRWLMGFVNMNPPLARHVTDGLRWEDRQVFHRADNHGTIVGWVDMTKPLPMGRGIKEGGFYVGWEEGRAIPINEPRVEPEGANRDDNSVPDWDALRLLSDDDGGA